jgi:hypothetical protein
MTPFEFLLFALATWRVAYMLVGEDGPWLIFRRLRESTGITHDQDGAVLIVPERTLPMLLSCVWCTSVWVSAGWTILWLLLPTPAVLLATWLALSTLAIGVSRLLSSRNVP